MGLTHIEAVIYSGLVSLGPSHARQLSERFHLAREDTYHVLKRLESKGLLQVAMENPHTYTALEPRAAVKNFVSDIDSRSDDLKQKAYEVGIWLDSIRQSVHESNQLGDERPVSSVKMLNGLQVFIDCGKRIRSCHSSFTAVYSGATFSIAAGLGLVNELLAASRRGIEVRLITEATRENWERLRGYSKKLNIRHQPNTDIGMRFSVIDGSQLFLSLAEPTLTVNKAKAIWSDNPPFVRGMRVHFEHVWSEARPLVDALRERPRQRVDA